MDLYRYDVVVATALVGTAVDHLLSEEHRDRVPFKLVRKLEQWRESKEGVECGDCVEVELANDDEANKLKLVSFDLLREIQNELIEHPMSDKTVHLSDLLRGSQLALPRYKPPPRNPQLVARLDRIKMDLERKEYNKMVKNIGVSESIAVQDFRTDLKATNRQLWMVVNFFLTVVGMFVFGYYAAYFAGFGNAGCVGLALVLSTAVFVADVYFIARSN